MQHALHPEEFKALHDWVKEAYPEVCAWQLCQLPMSQAICMDKTAASLTPGMNTNACGILEAIKWPVSCTGIYRWQKHSQWRRYVLLPHCNPADRFGQGSANIRGQQLPEALKGCHNLAVCFACTKVGEGGLSLLLTWEGTQPDLEPMLFIRWVGQV